MLSLMDREKFQEWSDSDELDGTISGTDRLTWTIANGFTALIYAANKIEIKPASLVPGASDDEGPVSSGQSPEEQQLAFARIAAIQNASLK